MDMPMQAPPPMSMLMPNIFDKFGPSYAEDFNDIPPEYRERAAIIVDRKVEQRVQEHMSGLWS